MERTLTATGKDVGVITRALTSKGIDKQGCWQARVSTSKGIDKSKMNVDKQGYRQVSQINHSYVGTPIKDSIISLSTFCPWYHQSARMKSRADNGFKGIQWGMARWFLIKQLFFDNTILWQSLAHCSPLICDLLPNSLYFKKGLGRD